MAVKWLVAVGLATCSTARGGGSVQTSCAISDHGATTDSKNNTAAIMAAIAACSNGGTVVVSGGAFKTGPLYVSGKDVTLEVRAGASLEAAFGPDDWPVSSSASLAASLNGPEHGIRADCPCRTKGCCPATSGHYVDFIVFENCNGCALTGEGTLFGKGGRPPSGFDWYYVRTLAQCQSINNAPGCRRRR